MLGPAGNKPDSVGEVKEELSDWLEDTSALIAKENLDYPSGQSLPQQLIRAWSRRNSNKFLGPFYSTFPEVDLGKESVSIDHGFRFGDSL